MKCLVRIFGLLLLLTAASFGADGPEDQYVQIYTLMQEGDTFLKNGLARQAMAKYAEAQGLLARFPSAHPGWNEAVVKFRLNYLAGKLAPLLAQFSTNNVPPTPLPPGPATNVIPPSPVTNDVPPNPLTNVLAPNLPTNVIPPTPPTPIIPIVPVVPATNVAPIEPENNARLVQELQERIQRLQADNATLVAKLKEALSVQPSATDPRELIKAEERNRALQKENDLLKVSLSQEQPRIGHPVEPDLLAEANRTLADLRTKFEQQSQDYLALKAENDFLKKQGAGATAPTGTDPQMAAQLQDARNALASLQADHDLLSLEKTALEKRMGTLESMLAAATNSLAGGPKGDPKKVKSLQEELAKQIAANKLAARENDARLRQIELEKSQLAKEKSDLESKLTASTTDALKQRKKIEGEMEDLRAKLARAEKQLAKSAGPQGPADLVQQVESLRSRLQVLEAQPLPYTAEEKAMLSKPDTKLLAVASLPTPALNPGPNENPTNTPSPSSKKKELPPGTGALVEAAERAFRVGNFAEAEAKYLDVLHQDEKNVYVLGNVAAIQIELNKMREAANDPKGAESKLQEAEKHLAAGLARDPEDDHCLFLMGQVLFKRKKLDEALDFLSRSAKVNPESALTQNFLGIVLSEKGLRKPAEAAFRKAIELQPGYASAHNNLAFVYATQDPPLLTLARWHYQKARDAGHPSTPDLEKLLAEPK
jgi:tetratricopeptide (TPR) repeat protein